MFTIPNVSPCRFSKCSYLPFVYRPLNVSCERAIGLHDAAGPSGYRLQPWVMQEGPSDRFNLIGPARTSIRWNGREFLLLRIERFTQARGVTDHPTVVATYKQLIPRKVR